MINKQQFLNKIKEIEFNDINSDVKIVMPKFGKVK